MTVEWEMYIKDLFSDSRQIGKVSQTDTTSPNILKSEFEHAIKIARSGKASSPHKIRIELFMMFNDGNIDLLTKLFNKIY